MLGAVCMFIHTFHLCMGGVRGKSFNAFSEPEIQV